MYLKEYINQIFCKLSMCYLDFQVAFCPKVAEKRIENNERCIFEN